MKQDIFAALRSTETSCIAILTMIAFSFQPLSILAQQDVWQRKKPLGNSITPRYGAVSFTINGKAYIGTGIDASHTKDFWEYDPVTNVWTQKADFAGKARAGAVAFSIGNTGFIGLGFSGTLANGYNSDFWQYNPVRDAWITDDMAKHVMY